METGYVAALATLSCWTVAIFILAKLSRLIQPDLLNKASLFFSVFLLGILVCVLDKINPLELFTKPNFSNWLWLGLSGILGKALGDYCGFACLRIMGPQRRALFTTLTPGFIWVFGLIILQEYINLWGLGGLSLTMVSLLFLLYNQAEKEEVEREKFGKFWVGGLFGILGALLTAVAFIFSKKTFVEPNTSISEFHGTWIRVIAAFVSLWLFDLLRRKNQDFIGEILSSKQKSLLLFSGILFGSVLGLSFSLMAIVRMETVVAYTIFSLTPLAVIVISVIVFNKKVPFMTWVWAVLAILGVVVLIWRDSL